MVHHIWNTGEIPTELTWTILVLIPKGDGTQTRGIGLNETLWKILEAIVDTRVKAAVVFHDILQGFIHRRGTGTVILEAKLAQELASIKNEPLFVVFLDLRKAYDTVDRERSLHTFEEYGMGPRMLRLLRNYWSNQKVIPRQNGYHGSPFPASRGQTQGGLFAPTGFNIVMDSVIREWLHTSVDNAGNIVAAGLGFTVEEHLALFYADDGYIGSRDDSWLSNALQILSNLFRRVGLESNAAKTKSMSCLPGKIHTNFSEPAYQRCATGAGATYRDRLREVVPCPDCGKPLSRGSLPLHRRRQHGREPPPTWNHDNIAATAGQLYTISLPNHTPACPCPVDGCPHSARTRAGLRTHFNHRHWNDLIHILEEHPAIYPQCPQCGLHVPHTQLNNRHYNTELCRKGMRRRANRAAERAAFEACGVTFTLNNELLEKVDTFRYLGRLLSYTNSDWPTIYHNLKKAQQWWGMVARVLVRDGASPAAMGMFYKGIVQAVLLYGCETWTLTTPMVKVLKSFHHKVARRITGRMPTLLPSGEWHYPPLADALLEAGLYPLHTYIQRRQATITRHIVTRPIYQLCLIASQANEADGSD
jgi:Reverse transcriptase (RNA-dependent DNA polymerase)